MRYSVTYPVMNPLNEQDRGREAQMLRNIFLGQISCPAHLYAHLITYLMLATFSAL